MIALNSPLFLSRRQPPQPPQPLLLSILCSTSMRPTFWLPGSSDTMLYLDYFTFVFFWVGVLFCCPGWRIMVLSQFTATSASWVQDLPASASWVAGIISMCHHTQLIFVFLVETGFQHVGQAGLELLTLWSACLGLLGWDYRCESSCSALLLSAFSLSFDLKYLK